MIERLKILFIIWCSLFIGNVNAADFLIEAESFLQKGGWGDIPGSSKLLASPLLPDTTLPYVS